MSSESSSKDAVPLIDELRSRYPLIDDVAGCFGENLPQERIPWFFGLLMAAATVPGEGATCIVLSKTRGTAAIAATLVSLVRLQNDFPRLGREYARTALSEANLVRVMPGNFVYEYDGNWGDEHPDQFSLRVQGSTDRRSFPIADVIRLEPTDRKRPKGTLKSRLGVSEPGELDDLLGLATYGNNSVIRNTVLAYMPQNQFQEMADAVKLTRKSSGSSEPLSAYLPWGRIEPDGNLATIDAYQVVGEPLIAVTREAQDLAAACRMAPVASKSVIIDGARGMARDLQAFDDIVETQRTLILASPQETEDISLLRDRGVPVLHMSATDMMLGENPSQKRSRSSLVGQSIRAADTQSRSRITTVDCSGGDLQTVAESLEEAARLVVGTEERSGVDELLGRLYSILFEIGESCFGVSEHVHASLQEVREGITGNILWMDRAVTEGLRWAAEKLGDALTSGYKRSEKAEAMLRMLSQADGEWAVATRSAGAAERIREELDVLGVHVPVMQIGTFGAVHEYEGIIIPAWPNARRFATFMALGVSRDIRILTYPFEEKWVTKYRNNERTRVQSNELTAEDRASLFGIDAGLLALVNPPRRRDTKSEPPPDDPIFEIEERIANRRRTRQPSTPTEGTDTRRARYVRFIGDCYALLTEWSSWHVLNDLIYTAQDDNPLPRTVEVSDLAPGDFVLFRAGGDSEFVRLIAEDRMGREEYRRIRTVSDRWKQALSRLGYAPGSVQRRLERHGLHRTVPTIAGWMNNPDRIGPGDDTDIDVIAEAAGDSYLTSQAEEVRNAISIIRGSHQAAGRRLTQLLLGELRGRVGELGDRPVLLDLHFGQAWVVQIDSIARRQRDYASGQVNRLIWDDDSVF